MSSTTPTAPQTAQGKPCPVVTALALQWGKEDGKTPASRQRAAALRRIILTIAEEYKQ